MCACVAFVRDAAPSHGPIIHDHADCSGYVRQRGLSVNRLLHVPGAGDFQMDRIDGLTGLQASQSSISVDGEKPWLTS